MFVYYPSNPTPRIWLIDDGFTGINPIPDVRFPRSGIPLPILSLDEYQTCDRLQEEGLAEAPLQLVAELYSPGDIIRCTDSYRGNSQLASALPYEEGDIWAVDSLITSGVAAGWLWVRPVNAFATLCRPSTEKRYIQPQDAALLYSPNGPRTREIAEERMNQVLERLGLRKP